MMYTVMSHSVHTYLLSHLWTLKNVAVDYAFLYTTLTHTVHLVPVCFITSDWPITAAVTETRSASPVQFWTVIWLKCINLARADVEHRCTDRLIQTASSSSSRIVGW